MIFLSFFHTRQIYFDVNDFDNALHSFLKRTSNFGAEAERSYIFAI